MPTQEFEDPLQNYDPQEYSDPFEQALVESAVSEVEATPYVSVPADTPIPEAIQKLAGLHVACLLVEDQGKLVGVFSDRDVLDKIALEADKFADRPVSEVMTHHPVFVYETDSPAAVLHVMAVGGHRHVPVLRHDGSIVGIVSPQRVTHFLKQHLTD